MVIAADYPFLDVFWTMIIFFCWVAWIWVLVLIISDLFSRHETSGWIKALWIVVLIILPFLGSLIYLIANGSGMSRRQAESVRASQEQFDSYVKSVSGGGAGDIAKAKELLDSGAINQQEYEQLKAKALA